MTNLSAQFLTIENRRVALMQTIRYKLAISARLFSFAHSLRAHAANFVCISEAYQRVRVWLGRVVFPAYQF